MAATPPAARFAGCSRRCPSPDRPREIPLIYDSSSTVTGVLGPDWSHGYEYRISPSVPREGGIVSTSMPSGKQMGCQYQFGGLGCLPLDYASRSNLAGALSSLGEFDKSLALYLETLRHLQARYGERHPYVGSSYYSAGRVHLAKGDVAAAAPFVEKSVAIQRKRLPPSDPDLARTLVALGACLADLGRFGEAERLLLDGYRSFQSSRGDSHPITRHAAGQLVSLYEKSGQALKAVEWRPRSTPL